MPYYNKMMMMTTMCLKRILHTVTIRVYIQKDTVSQKSFHLKLSVTLSYLNRFSIFLHCRKVYKICYKTIQPYPSLLRDVATLPWEIKKSIFVDIHQTWKIMQTKCILSAPISIPQYCRIYLSELDITGNSVELGRV